MVPVSKMLEGIWALLFVTLGLEDLLKSHDLNYPVNYSLQISERQKFFGP